MAVDAGRVDGVRVDVLERGVVLDVAPGVGEKGVLGLDLVLEADAGQLAVLRDDVDESRVVGREADLEPLEHTLQQEQVLPERQVGEELQLLREREELEVVAEGHGELLLEDRQAGEEDEQVRDLLAAEDVLHELVRRVVWDLY